MARQPHMTYQLRVVLLSFVLLPALGFAPSRFPRLGRGDRHRRATPSFKRSLHSVDRFRTSIDRPAALDDLDPEPATLIEAVFDDGEQEQIRLSLRPSLLLS